MKNTEKYITWVKNHRSETTALSYMATLKDYFSVLPELTLENIEHYISILRSRRNKPKSINLKLEHLRIYNKWCSEREFAVKLYNLIEDVPVTKTEKVSVLNCSLDQFDIIERAKAVRGDKFSISRNVAILNMFLVTGCRVSELISMKLEDIDFEALTVVIRKGKGNKERTVAITEGTIAVLNEYFEKVKDIPNPEHLVFLSSRPTKDGSRKLNRSSVLRMVNKITDGECGNHTLRHLSATAKLNAGVAIDQVQDDLGHSNIATTKIYAERSMQSKHLSALAIGI